ncbi:MAG: protein phosphatase 1 regulatory subunit 42 [Candidatus Lokiarchaeota archaeon]|nr:protein phosphatase 1 regulatory subunit 42 [Candidatus Lokiarchaeota archaeon]
MAFTPSKIFEQYVQNLLDKRTTTELLTTIIDNSDEESLRVSALIYFGKLGLNDSFFEILEQLLISDSNQTIRLFAIDVIRENFLHKAFPLINWAIQHENSYPCQVALIKTLKEIQDDDVKHLLINHLHQLLNESSPMKIRESYFMHKYNRAIKQLLLNDLLKLTQNQLADIILNYITILELSLSYQYLSYEIDEELGAVTELNLSDLELETKGLPYGWKYNIESIEEITGLINLKHLIKLDLSNNNIRTIKDLMQMNQLEELNLSNNKLISEIEIEYLNNMCCLQLIDLHGNPIAEKITKSDFKPKVIVILKTHLQDLEERFEQRMLQN